MKNNILSINISCLVECPFTRYLSDCPYSNLKKEKELYSAIEEYLDDEDRHHQDYIHHQKCAQKRINK